MTGFRINALLASVAAGAVVVGGLVLSAPPTGATGGNPPGVVNTFAIGTNVDLVSYDVAASSTGRAYIGWITNAPGTTRAVHLCTLPVTATSCAGRTETLTNQPSSSDDLKVLVTGDDTVKLVWFHDTDQSINGPENALISIASAPHGQGLALSSDTTTAPSFGSLLTAEIGPNGHIWTVAYAGLPETNVQVHTNPTTNYETVNTPVVVQFAELAFIGGKAVLALSQYGPIDAKIRYAVRSTTGNWGSFHAVANTRNLAEAALETTHGHGMRLIATYQGVPYRPVLSRWTGTGFTAGAFTPDSCDAASHDGYVDLSGRLLDVSQDCATKLAVANYADGTHVALTRFPINGVLTLKPQIASGTRGIATVVWSVEGTTFDKLRVAHVRLADPTRTVSHHGTGGRVTVTGPRTCLPPVNVHVGWTHHPDANWSFLSGSLRLGNTAVVGSTLDGAKLTPGKSYTLIATATFGRSGNHNQVRATLGFRTCGTG
jgi:hypothetical protein